MRTARSRSPDLDEVDVLIDEDATTDEGQDALREILHQLAIEAMTLRAGSPGDPHPWPDDGAPDGMPGERPGEAPAAGVLATALRWLRRPSGRRVVVAVALVVALGVGQEVVQARADARRDATLVAAPGVLDATAGPVVEAWRVPGRVAVPRDDALLVVDRGRLRRVDPATGEDVWVAPAEVGAVADGGRCFTAGQRVVVCVDGEVVPLASRDGAPGRVVVVDVATGRPTLTLAPEGALLTAEAVDGDLLTLTALPDGRVHADRWDTADGVRRWERVSARPAVATTDLPVVEHRAGSVTVGTVSFDVATGEQLALDQALRGPLRTDTYALPGVTLTWSTYPGAPAGRGRMTPALAPVRVLTGPPLVAPVHDGSEPRTVVVRSRRGDRLRGIDVRTGSRRWSVPWVGASALRPTAQVDGVLLLDDGVGTVALDVRTGQRRWAVRTEQGVVTGPALTDGQVVLLPARDDSGTHGVVARRLADGAEVWRSATPEGTRGLAVVGKRLVGWTGDAVMGLGPAG